MTRGSIEKDHTSRLELIVAGRRSAEQVGVIIDSGFNGDLSIPKPTGIRLGLELVGSVECELADGRLTDDMVFQGRLLWEGQWFTLRITLTDCDEGLLGAGFLSQINAKVHLDYQSREFAIEP